jgi:hypothetical protein
MNLRSTHTLAAMEVSPDLFEEVRAKFVAAGYDHVFLSKFHDDHDGLDMTGIALVAGERREMVKNPKHYHSHPSGLAAVDLCELMTWCAGSGLKYLWRLGQKDEARQELGKSHWYFSRHVERGFRLFETTAHAYQFNEMARDVIVREPLGSMLHDALIAIRLNDVGAILVRIEVELAKL